MVEANCHRTPFTCLAAYNRWMNRKLYAACSTLSSEAVDQNSGAYFGSILATLNHILVGDLIWLNRFAAADGNPFPSLNQLSEFPKPSRLDQVLFGDFSELSLARDRLDDVICEFAEELTRADDGQLVRYSNMAGVASNKPLTMLIWHVFNHQTHHRGQVSTLLSQQGIDLGVTDLLELIPDASS